MRKYASNGVTSKCLSIAITLAMVMSGIVIFEGDAKATESVSETDFMSSEIDVQGHASGQDDHLVDIRAPPYYRAAFTGPERENQLELRLKNDGDSIALVKVSLYHVEPDRVNESFLKTTRPVIIFKGEEKTFNAFRSSEDKWQPTQVGRNWIRGEIYALNPGEGWVVVNEFRESFWVVPGSRPILELGDTVITESTTWENLTVMINGNLTVAENTELSTLNSDVFSDDLNVSGTTNIFAGDTINMNCSYDGKYTVRVYSSGTLNIYGNLTNDPDTKHYWFYMNGTLNICKESPPNEPGLVEFTYGDTSNLSNPGGIICTTSNVVIEEGATIRNSATHGIYFMNNSGGVVKDSYIKDNGGDGIVCIDGSSPQIENNEITWNDRYGIYAENSTPIIKNNGLIRYNGIHGIYVKDVVNASAKIEGNTIKENMASGIYCVDSDIYVANNTISSNGQGLVFGDNMENGVGNWTCDDGLWHMVNNESGTADPWNLSYSGDWSWWYGNDTTGDYNTSSRNSGNLTSPVIDLQNATTATLTFWSWYETDTLGNATDQRKIVVQSDSSSHTFQLEGENMSEWTRQVFNISQFAGKNINVTFYFDTINGENNTFQGWYIDDVEVITSYPAVEGDGIFCNGETMINAYNNTIFSNNWNGINCDANSLTQISNNNITSNKESGIRLYSSSNITISNNTISNNYNGTSLYSSSNNYILNNSIMYQTTTGIKLDVSDNNTISNNNLTNSNSATIAIYGPVTTTETLKGNFINNNTFNSGGSPSFDIYRLGPHRVTNNTFLNSGMLDLMAMSSNCFIANNTFINTNSGGSTYIQIGYHCTNHNITNNNFTNSGINFYIADYLEDWNSHSIDTSNMVNGKPIYYWKNEDNGIIPSGAGQIILANCSNIMVENQNVSGGFAGISLGFSNSNTVVNNIASMNEGYGGDGFGIFVKHSDDNLLINNTLEYNTNGLFTYYSENNTIFNNAVSNNSYGIKQFMYSKNNKIYYNNIINNTNQASDSGSNNSWDNGYPSGGNYWSDYNGADNYSGEGHNESGSDGIGDTNYTITGTIVDRYPLMNPLIDGRAQRPQIRINNNIDFKPSRGISSGNGSEGNPWIIENYAINGTNSGCCIYIGNTTEYFTINNCYLYNASGVGSDPYFKDAGLILYNVTHGLIENSLVLDNGQCGIYIKDSNFNDIAYNTINSNAYQGLYFTGTSNNNSVNNNEINSNGQYGVLLYGSSVKYNTLNNNDISSNSQHGIQITQAKNNTITENNINSNGQSGISLTLAKYNTIDKNTISSNVDYGIKFLLTSHENIITDNTLFSNGNYNIYISGSNYNSIYHNNFNNIYQAYDSGTNYWDNGYPSGGNYWSDYNGYDNNSGPNQNISGCDGIGDSNYTITGIVVDDYPLMNPVIDGRVQRPPIRINNYSEMDSSHGVLSGDGTDSNPWIIGNYWIDGTDSGYCIFIGNISEHYVIIRNCYVHNASGIDSEPYYRNCGITLNNVTEAKLENNTVIDNDRYGIYLRISDTNALIFNSVVSNDDHGLYIYDSDYNVINYNDIISNTYIGLYFAGSSNNNSVNNNEICSNGQYGIYLTGSSVKNNTINNNNLSLNSQDGIYITLAKYNTMALTLN